MSIAEDIMRDVTKIIKEEQDRIEKQLEENLEYTLIGVMHFVDKWLEGDELTHHEVKRALIMREKVLQIIEEQQEEINKLKTEIVEAIEKQIPKKPEIIEGKMWVCPTCNNNLLWLYEKYPEKKTELNKGLPFCLSCGQAIDWEVKE